MTLQIDNASEFADGRPNVLGGPHVTADPYNTALKYPQFDRFILGPGEEQFASLLGNNFKMNELDDLRPPG